MGQQFPIKLNGLKGTLRSLNGPVQYGVELNEPFSEAFLKICIPHNELWDKFGWRGKNVSQIVSQIVDVGIPTSTMSKKNNQFRKFWELKVRVRCQTLLPVEINFMSGHFFFQHFLHSQGCKKVWKYN